MAFVVCSEDLRETEQMGAMRKEQERPENVT